MAEKGTLKQYRVRRDLKHSNEPVGRKHKSSKIPIFVIHKHDASHLHYDLRLEIGGVLVSWAVPKGPSTDPQQKRLAIRTDDHPMEYGNFEGVIPEGHYGAGTVMLWDQGTFKNIKTKEGKLVPLKTCLQHGQLEIFLQGKKLHGGYALLRTKLSGDNQWLLIKMRDEFADVRRNPGSTENKSVATSRTMVQITQASKGDE